MSVTLLLKPTAFSKMMDDRDSAVFPQEIFDLIIDDLGQQVESGLLEEREPSKKAIRACSGASRAFHRRARLYLAQTLQSNFSR